jgi:phosphatidylserine/phosphatidylglycerophosphate/cardiolipin synthase-like enzyme
MKSTKKLALIAIAFAAISSSAFAGKSLLDRVESGIEAHRASTAQDAPAGAQFETAFSPRGGCEQLVIKVIASSRKEIRLLAYGFTNPNIVQALLAAKRRGVDVRVAVDYKANISEDRSRKGMAALNLLANAGIPVRTVSVYPIHHDKVIVSDGRSVETGSFNYTAAAEKSNSENVLVVWNNPQLASTYLQHWERNWNQGRDFISSY